MKPYKCPVCEGTGNVAKGFYTDDPKRTKCRACIQGVVYGSDNDAVTVPVPYPVPQPYPVPYPTYPPAPVIPWQPYRRPWITWEVVNSTATATTPKALDTTFSVMS